MEAVKAEDLYQVVSLGNLQANGQRAVLARNQAKADGEGYWNWLDVFENGELKRLTTLGQEKSYALVNNRCLLHRSRGQRQQLALQAGT